MKSVSVLKTMFFFSLLFISKAVFSQTTIFDYTTTWKYLNDGTDQGTSWYATGFNDASWSSGPGLLHVGESGGTNLGMLRQTTYFRKSFTISGISSYTDFDFNLVCDDGAIVYVNGVKVISENMPATYSYATNASSQVNG